jgi:hypothetical protein
VRERGREKVERKRDARIPANSARVLPPLVDQVVRSRSRDNHVRHDRYDHCANDERDTFHELADLGSAKRELSDVEVDTYGLQSQ